MTDYLKLDDDEFVTKALDKYKESRRKSSNWRREAKELYEFRAGKQWTDDELAYLEEQRRPPVTFNRAGTIVDAVVGAEVANRQEVRYFPRTNDDAMLNEVATNAAKWVRDQCNAEDEETDAFEDVVICGMGWTETRIDYDTNIDGQILIERIDPTEMYWSSSAIKQNLEDADCFFREKWIDKDEIRQLWPDADEILPSLDMAPEFEDQERNADPPYYEREATGIDNKKNQVRVLEYQWCERTAFYRVQNPMTGAVESVTNEQYKKLQKRFPEIRSVKQKKKQWYRAFMAGKTLLERNDSPIPEESTFKCITGKRDKKDNSWYGLMRGIKEPQEWANKFFSQILHIINSNSKGGFFYETGALKDPNQAKEDLAKPEGVIELNPGGMGRVKERQMFTFPASIDRMLEFAISSIRDVPGVNLELLGMANREQAGVVEAQRTRQALGVLAPMFNNLRRYRKNQGRLLLSFIREYIADGRLIRVVGEEGAQVIPLFRDPMSYEFDIIVDQSPSSPNAKTEAWVALTNILPVLAQAGFPIPKEIVDIIPLPESLIGKWKETVKNGQQLPPQVQEQMQAMQQEIEKLGQENQSLKQNHDIKAMEAQANAQIKQQEIALEGQQAEHEAQLDIAKTQQELELKRAQAEAELALKRQEMEAEIALKQIELEAEFAFKKQELDQNTKLKKMELAQTVTEDQVAEADFDRKTLNKMMDKFTQALDGVNKPRRFRVDRDAKGFIKSVQTEH